MDKPWDRCAAIVLFFTVFMLIRTQSANARQCYVCGIGPADLMYDTMRFATAQLVATSNNNNNSSDLGNLPSTDDTDRLSCESMEMPEANLHAYLVECPAGWKGCFTQIDGTAAVRSCNRYPIDDCKMANGITYCYCNTDRCNSREAPIVLSQKAPGPTRTVQSILNALGYLDPHELAESPNDEDDEGDDDIDRDDQFEASGNGGGSDRWPPTTTERHVETVSEGSTAEELARSKATTTDPPTNQQTPRSRAHLVNSSGGWRLGGLSATLLCFPAYPLTRYGLHWV